MLSYLAVRITWVSRLYEKLIDSHLNPQVAIELITKHIARQLDERGFSVRSRLADIAKRHKEGPKLPETVIEMEMTPQIKFIQTMMRNKNTCREDLRFFSERLSRLVVERALSELHFKEKKIMTPIGCEYTGLERTSSVIPFHIANINDGIKMIRFVEFL